MTPCQGRSLLFDNPETIDEARQICKRECPALIECRFWALHNDVAGVCGGLTDRERALWRRDNGKPLDGWTGHLHDREVLRKFRQVAA